MHWQMVKDRWNDFSHNAKETWNELTDDDLERVQGSREELIGTLQQRCGYDREQAETEADAWSRRLHVRYEEPGPQPV
jgi:uncharacterized protein YjbJ (UPF0337 family)